jgi:hypothetical protein
MKTRVLSIAGLMLLFGFAGTLTAQAADAPLDVVVDLSGAIQFDHPHFVAAVIAHGGTDLDVDLLLNGVLLPAPAKVSRVEYDKGNLTAWKIVYNGLVVKQGDTLTAVVTDVGGDSATKDALCGPGFVKLRQTALCK